MSKIAKSCRRQMLLDELGELMEEIEKQIHVIKTLAEDRQTSASEMMDTHGGYLLSPLLVAKAQTLSSIILLQDKE